MAGHRGHTYVYDIPIQNGSSRDMLRCSRVYDWDSGTNIYTAYGVWDGYDEDIGMPGRNVKSLSQLAGRDYQLLYPIQSSTDDEKTHYEGSQTLTMYRALDIEEVTLPAGTYFLVYEVEDMFGRPHAMEPIEMHWDGQTITYPEGFVWEGTVTLNAKAH